MALRKLNWGDWASLSRVPLALLFVGLFRAEPGALLTAAIVVAILAQISDHLDGFLARKTGVPSVSGWLFDSVSDRAFYIGALVAFDREFGLNEIVLWAFILREICLYAFRIVTGDFERLRPGFRILALTHAGFVRLGIVVGCILPYGIMPAALQNGESTLNGIFGFSTFFGYVCLYLLVRASREDTEAGDKSSER
jgi:phosphatidylglycerophosphate synthase